jgi:1-acyl-sn-glycerol-3-phosphate acyltransferase
MMKDFLGKIWAVWGMIAFIIVMLLFFPIFACCFFWKDPKRSKIAYPFFRKWMQLYLPLIGVRVRLRGKEHFKNGENYIVLCNHNSLMDVPVSSPWIPGPNKTIAKIEMSRIPVFGIIYRIGSILVDRKDKDSRRKSFVLMKAALDTGLHMCIYPEGTRNKTTDPLKEFHDGAFKLAVDTGKTVIPAILMGTKKILPNNKGLFLWPGIVRFHFLPPVEPGNDAEALKQQVFTLMWDYYAANS